MLVQGGDESRIESQKNKPTKQIQEKELLTTCLSRNFLTKYDRISRQEGVTLRNLAEVDKSKSVETKDHFFSSK